MRGWSRIREFLFRAVQVALAWPVRALFRTTYRGRERVPRTGGILVAFNHPSFLDPVLVEAVIPRPVYFLAKRWVFGNRLSAFLLVRICGHIPIFADRTNERAIDAAVDALAEGRAVATAPEGGINRTGRVGRGRTGVAILAYRTGCPVYPVGIQGTAAAWPPGRLLPRPFRRTAVAIGPPITVAADASAANDPRRLLELTDRIMLALGELSGMAYASPELARSASSR